MKLCKVHPFFQKERSDFCMPMNLWGKKNPFSPSVITGHEHFQSSYWFFKLPLYKNYRITYSNIIKENGTESTKYMYKYTIHICTKTSLNVSLTCSWGFLHGSGLPDTAMLTWFFFLHQLSQTSSQWWARQTNKARRKLRQRKVEWLSGEECKQKQSLLSLLDHTQRISLKV